MDDIESSVLEEELKRLISKRDSLKKQHQLRQDIDKTRQEIKGFHRHSNVLGKIQGGVGKMQKVAANVNPRLQNMERVMLNDNFGMFNQSNKKKDWNGWKK